MSSNDSGVVEKVQSLTIIKSEGFEPPEKNVEETEKEEESESERDTDKTTTTTTHETTQETTHETSTLESSSSNLNTIEINNNVSDIPTAPRKDSNDSILGSSLNKVSPAKKKGHDDFIFGNTLGEGSYGAVVLGTDKETGNQYAIKILEKRHIIKENKAKYVTTERDILLKCNHPNVVKLFFTFRSESCLYYVLELCPKGELLTHLKNIGSFDENTTRFYTAEIINALEHLHSKGIVHRDLKPENILLSADFHVKLTDFGTAKLLASGEERSRSNSFVGTAEYVSPELINHKETCCASDLWALGSIVYQMLTGKLPFRGRSEYLTFQKISNREVSYPKLFPAVARDLIDNLLIMEPEKRIGAREKGFAELKEHPFFHGIDFANLHLVMPPPFTPSSIPFVFEEEPPQVAIPPIPAVASDVYQKWGKFLNEGEIVVEHGIVSKRKGLSTKKRMLILTNTPRILYIDPKKMQMKGVIPWSDQLRPEVGKNNNFYIHTPKRKYLLEDEEANAQRWADAINELLTLSKQT